MKFHKNWAIDMRGDRQENLRKRRNEFMLLFYEYVVDHEKIVEADGMGDSTMNKVKHAHKLMVEVCGEVEMWNHTL